MTARVSSRMSWLGRGMGGDVDALLARFGSVARRSSKRRPMPHPYAWI